MVAQPPARRARSRRHPAQTPSPRVVDTPRGRGRHCAVRRPAAAAASAGLAAAADTSDPARFGSRVHTGLRRTARGRRHRCQTPAPQPHRRGARPALGNLAVATALAPAPRHRRPAGPATRHPRHHGQRLRRRAVHRPARTACRHRSRPARPCSKAEADGTLTLEQPGTAPIVATFALKGADLDITKPGRVELEFTTPGELVAGFDGTWKFTGTLDFAATADEHIDRVVIDGRISPAAHPHFDCPVFTCVSPRPARPAASPTSWNSLRPPGNRRQNSPAAPPSNGPTATSRARGRHAAAPRWWPRYGRGPTCRWSTDTHGAFALDAWAGAVQASAEGEFSGTEWQRYLPELAAVGRLHRAPCDQPRAEQRSVAPEKTGGHRPQRRLGRRLGTDLTRPIALPPGGDGNISRGGSSA